MSMRPVVWGEVPAETVRVARAAFPKGSLAIRIRDELGPLFADGQFADLFPARGRPAWSPGRLALVCVLQFVEGLSDRQAAEAVRARIDFKYALGLGLEDPGFDYSVLSEFRDRLVQAEAGMRVLDGILAAAADRGLLRTSGRARTDSTHVLSSARSLTRLAMLIETVRSALEALAGFDPDWTAAVAEPTWFDRYRVRPDELHLPKGRAKRQALAEQAGADGARLLDLIEADDAPAGVGGLPQVAVLSRIWRQQFDFDGPVARGKPPAARTAGVDRLVTPHDPEARAGGKPGIFWDGWKVHVTETCDDDAPHLIVNVATTPAAVTDVMMTEPVHAALAGAGRLPVEHLVDAGYVTAHLMVRSAEVYGLTLTGPALPAISPQTAAADGFSLDDFTIDWDAEQVTCPNGTTTGQWRQARSQHDSPVIRIQFSPAACRPCPLRQHCTASPRGRNLTLRPRAEHQALRQARTLQDTDTWKQRYKTRAGVEGTISQAVLRCGLRRSRYRGLARTALQHQLTGAAINLVRIDNHLTDTPQARTRPSRFQTLRPARQEPDGTQN